MKLSELDLIDWKKLAAEYKEKNPDLGYLFIMPMSVITGSELRDGFIMNSGHKYIGVHPRETNLRMNSPLHHLAVEQKFHEWVKNNRAPKMCKPKPIGSPTQGDLFQ